MYKPLRLNWQEQPVKLFYVEIYADAHVFLAVEAYEIDTRIIDFGLVVDQRSLRYSALVDQE